MKYLLMILGYGWAIFGAFGIYISYTATVSMVDSGVVTDFTYMPGSVAALSLLVLCVIPGLIIGALGSNIRSAK